MFANSTTALYGALSIMSGIIFYQHPTQGLIKVPIAMDSYSSDSHHDFLDEDWDEQAEIDAFLKSIVEPTFIIRKQNRFDALTGNDAMTSREINMDSRRWRNKRQAHCQSKYRHADRVRKQKLRTAA